MVNLADLFAQKEQLEKTIATLQSEERAGAIAKVQELMAAHGLTLADLSGRSSAAVPKAPKTVGTGKVAAKYRNQATGESWSGRGLKPKWLTAALAEGKKSALQNSFCPSWSFSHH